MIIRTVKEGRKHNHIVYINDTTGVGQVAENKEHTHIYNPEIKELEPTGKNQHTHKLNFNIIEQEETPETDDKELAGRVRTLFKTAEKYEEEFRREGLDSDNFYRGQQWTEQQKQQLSNDDRAALTINEIEPKLDILSGHQRQNRTDIRFLPTEEGDFVVADILTQLVKNINNQNQYEREETQVFDDMTIVGRGTLRPYISYERNIQGDIKIERDEWDEVYFGPHNKPNADDAEYMARAKKMSWAKVKQLWPDKKDEIEVDTTLHIDNKAMTRDSRPGGSYEDPKSEVPLLLETKFVDVAKKDYLVIEVWEKTYKSVWVAANIAEDFYQRSDNWTKQEIGWIESFPGFEVIQTVKLDMAVTIIAGHVVLNKFIDDEYNGEFSAIPVYAKKRKHHIWGKVQNAKDPNREVNKRTSQTIDILNRAAAYGWFTDQDTFDSRSDENDFKRNAGKPGFVQKIKDVLRPPFQVLGTKFPAEIVNLVTVMTQKLREILNVNPELQGLTTRAESGVAIAQKKMQGLIGNEFLFDNLSGAKIKLGKIYVSFIQKIYTVDRMLRILENNNRKEQFELAGKPFEKFARDDLQALLENADLTKYDVVVAESAFNPTTRTTNFLMWAELAGKGIPVPPGLLIALSDLPDKEKWKEEMAQLQQEQAAQEGRQPAEPVI
jgi:hypothetical protein